jgi:hypothetical protein
MSMTFEGKRLVSMAALAGALIGFGCGGSETPKTDAPSTETNPEAGGEAAPEAATKIDFDAAKSRGKTAMFVPAPTEFQAALKATGANIDLTALASGSTRSIEGKSKQIIALETGVRVADLLLTAQTGDSEAIAARITGAREGLASLGGDAAVLARIDQVKVDFEKGILPADKLGAQLDILARDIQADLDKNVGKDIATLVQAGGWVEGVNLLSGALADGFNADAAALLNQPSVLEYFLSFLKDSAPAKAGDDSVTTVIIEMEKMGALAGKDALTAEDVKALNGHAQAILAKF